MPTLRGDLEACLFDMDGVLTRTAIVHAKAWKETFDAFLKARAGDDDGPFVPFDASSDYAKYVDGKPRADGVRDFLASRDIHLPEGSADGEPGAQTVAGLGNAKNARLLELVREDGVATFDDAVRFVHRARDGGLRTAVVSSSANTEDVLRSAGIRDLFEIVVDGNTLGERHLKGKPAPDSFLEAARELGVAPGAAVVFEDALSGVAAGAAGHFGEVVGVDRVGGDHAKELHAHGADVVVADLDDLELGA